MKRQLFLLSFLFMAFQMRALDLSILITQFYADHSPYIEVYLHTVASTVSPLKSDGDQNIAERQVKVRVLFKQAGKVIRFDNFIIESGRQTALKDFVALKRYGLKPGKYIMDFDCSDIADPTNVYRDSVELDITAELKKPTLSNIQLVADTIRSEDRNLAKNGYFYELIPFGYVNSRLNRIGVYFESYNTNKLEADKSAYSIKISKKDGSGNYSLIARNNFRRSNNEQDAITTWFDATYYESGTYMMQIYLMDGVKNIIDSSQTYFTKSNPVRDEALLSKKLIDEVENSFAGKLTEDQLNYALRAIAMLVKQSDVELLNRILKDPNTTAKTNFLFQFYKEKSPVHPDEYYVQYMEVAKAVDKNYKSGLGYGFETDRGLIFMKYGKPSDMVNIQDDPSSAPYEVWLYYDIPKLNQSNVKFLFYNPFLDGVDYRLLQSNARGEVRNPNWKKELYKVANRAPENTAPDNFEIPGGFNRHASEWLEDL
ncbi:MAG: GWxTD domain-containing protein [Saprospiraceae bacterium]|nr:GWxTD domain-containing protein [Candidatus Brachybacter algidus]MBL0118867.1 GWxTD domain-containing protein [Candidatus Brachybacter algidus]